MRVDTRGFGSSHMLERAWSLLERLSPPVTLRKFIYQLLKFIYQLPAIGMEVKGADIIILRSNLSFLVLRTVLFSLSALLSTVGQIMFSFTGNDETSTWYGKIMINMSSTSFFVINFLVISPPHASFVMLRCASALLVLQVSLSD